MTPSKTQIITGRILSGIAVLFLLMDAIMKFFKPQAVVDTTVNLLGFSEAHIIPIGATLLVITILYLLPRTAVLGAVLLTGYFGGAVAAQMRIGSPLAS